MKNVKRKKGFTLIELLVVIAIIALLLAILMPALRKAKKITQSVVCRSNLKQFALAYSLYGNDNESSYPQNYESANVNAEDAWYLGAILPYYKNKKMRMCPSTKRRNNPVGNVGATFKDWGPFAVSPPGRNWFDSEAVGSFGFNNWVANPAPGSNYWNLDANNAIRRSTESMSYNTPIMADSAFVDTAPKHTDSVQLNNDDFSGASWANHSLRYYTIDRHSGGINGAFGDYSVRHVAIKQIYTLKWHKNFITSTVPLNGGWPAWTNRYKNF